MQKLILLYGFAASGKTTLAKKYIEEHPMTMAVEGDQLIGMIGQWRKNEATARQLVELHTKSIVENHLRAGYDVIVPHLLSDSTEIESFENITKETGASFHEVYIDITKEDAVNRLLTRGCWGEEGSRKLTEDDREMLIGRFEYMENAMKGRTQAISISSRVGKVDEVFNALLKAIE